MLGATDDRMLMVVHLAMSLSFDRDEETATSDEHQQHLEMSLLLVSELVVMAPCSPSLESVTESDVERELLRSWQLPEHRTRGRTT